MLELDEFVFQLRLKFVGPVHLDISKVFIDRVIINIGRKNNPHIKSRLIGSTKVYFPTLLKSWLFTSTYMTVLGVTVDAACTSNA